MALITLQNDDLLLEVLPETGASLVRFEGRIQDSWIPLLRATPPEAVATKNPSAMSSFTLAPWSNRIPNAQFQFQNRTYHLTANTPEGYAMHGDVRRRPWKIISNDPTSLRCTIDSRDFQNFNFPFPLRADIQYQLSQLKFSTTILLTNIGESDMPAGFGFHPYFNRTLRGFETEEAQLQFSVEGVYPPLPSGPMQPIAPDQDFSSLASLGTRDINNCFGGWKREAQIRYAQAGVGLRLECSHLMEHLVLFTPPDKPYFAVEPISHATNGFNLLAQGQSGTGIQVLTPGESMQAQFSIELSR